MVSWVIQVVKYSISFIYLKLDLCFTMQSGSGYISATLSSVGDTQERALKIKEWEARVLQEEMAASQGIKIRRRPPTAPPSGYEGPIDVSTQDISNTPLDVLEEIIWYKDFEVSQV